MKEQLYLFEMQIKRESGSEPDERLATKDSDGVDGLPEERLLTRPVVLFGDPPNDVPVVAGHNMQLDAGEVEAVPAV